MERGYKSQNGVCNEAFLRKFAAEIGVALRERDDATVEQLRQDEPSIVESVDDLYRSLVFDEPLIDHIPNLPVVVSELSRQLLLESSYALSNRLVNGIVYLCNQNTAANKISDNIVSHSTMKIAMVKLAFCVLIDIPLECCRYDDEENSSSEITHTNKIRNTLGSYKGTSSIKDSSTQDGKTNNLEGKVDPAARINNIYEASNNNENNGDKITTLNNDDITSSTSEKDGSIADEKQQQQIAVMEEVFAVESDPSDFDFGGDIGTATETQILQENWQELENDWLDPKLLSRPTNISLQQTRDAIGSLLQRASYTLFEPIFHLSQKETSRYLSQLAKLILSLLKPRKKDESSLSLLDSSMDYVILSPLWIMRDAAMYHTNSTSSMRQSCVSNYVQKYLEILQTLLAIDQAYLKTNPDLDLCVASIAGMSALAYWCSMQKKSSQPTIDAIVDSMNDLSHIVERAEKSYKKNLHNTLIPILEALSAIHYDRVDSRNSSNSFVPQSLLNTGFLRQILALATVDKSSTGDLGFHHALWGLCIAFPTIVGKYVYRYPGSSQMIRSYAIRLDSSEPENCVQCILWNTYGWYQCKESSLVRGVNITWMNGSSSLNDKKTLNAPRLTEDECSEVAAKAWSRLCLLVKQALEVSNCKDDAGVERVIQEWARLLVLSRDLPVAIHFKSLLDPSLLDDISTVISNQSGKNDQKTSDKPLQAEKSNDYDKEDDKPSRRLIITSKARKLLKDYKLFFLETGVGTSKTD